MNHSFKLMLSSSLLAAVALFIGTACSDLSVTDTLDESAMTSGKSSAIARSGPGALTVLTRNVYIGAGVDAIIAEQPLSRLEAKSKNTRVTNRFIKQSPEEKPLLK